MNGGSWEPFGFIDERGVPVGTDMVFSRVVTGMSSSPKAGN